MQKSKLLIVEGEDDLHVIAHILKNNGYENQIFIKQEGGFESIKTLLLQENFERLIKTLKVELKGGGLAALGLVIDADINPKARWLQIRETLKYLGYQKIPVSPVAGGLILSGAQYPPIGLWLMPDNSNAGALEHFVSALIPEDSEQQRLWQIAETTVEQLPVKPFLRPDADRSQKAKIHTYLAWQTEPGKPMGTAITARYLDSSKDYSKPIIDWLRRLFNLQAGELLAETDES